MYICPPPPSSDQDYDARQVHTCATTPHKEGKHAPVQSTSFDRLAAKSALPRGHRPPTCEHLAWNEQLTSLFVRLV